MEARRPTVLFQEQSLVIKLLRDLLTDDYTAIRSTTSRSTGG